MIVGDTMQVDVEFYTMTNGRKPAKEFLDELDPKMRAKMVRIIQLLETNGPDLRMPYSKYLGNGLYELRAKVGSDISRELYFFFSGQKAILTNEFIKKTQSTPRIQLNLAEKYKRDYEERADSNE